MDRRPSPPPAAAASTRALMRRGARPLEELLASGMDAACFDGERVPDALEAVLRAVLLHPDGGPDHAAFLRFAGPRINACVPAVCRYGAPELAKRVLEAATGRARRHGLRVMARKRGGITVDEVLAGRFPGMETYVLVLFLDSGRVSVRDTVAAAAACAACDRGALLEALLRRRDFDAACDLVGRLPRTSFRTEHTVAYDLVRALMDAEARLASELVWAVGHGRAPAH
eukprot:jgi/Tetstr1/454169/TSEL_041088.t1